MFGLLCSNFFLYSSHEICKHHPWWYPILIPARFVLLPCTCWSILSWHKMGFNHCFCCKLNIMSCMRVDQDKIMSIWILRAGWLLSYSLGPLYKMVELPNQSILQEVGTNRLINDQNSPTFYGLVVGLAGSVIVLPFNHFGQRSKRKVQCADVWFW